MRLQSLLFAPAVVIALLAACTVNNTSDGPSGSDPCSTLARKCPFCTEANLKQTCEAAVKTSDSASCQNGLDDRDIQASCVESSSSSSSTSSTSSSGGASSSSSSTSGGGGSTCNGGACVCVGVNACDLACDGSGCAFECKGPGGCKLSCPGGNCSARNTGAGSLTLECAGGACAVTSESSGSSTVSCGGKGNCTCTKMGPALCTSNP
ncbi:MAG: hypothetical protein KIT84_12035 [Labilithrix sp.]|nr:hypothetical protein [Labilithrix sp.]MCW5811741.1 hypothetical protein [Labilithrix sp.]